MFLKKMTLCISLLIGLCLYSVNCAEDTIADHARLEGVNFPATGLLKNLIEKNISGSIIIYDTRAKTGNGKCVSDSFQSVPNLMTRLRTSLVKSQTLNTMSRVAAGSVLPGMMSEKRTEMVDKAVSRTLSNARMLSDDLKALRNAGTSAGNEEVFRKEAIALLPGAPGTDIGILKSTAARNTADNIKAMQAIRTSLKSPDAKCLKVIESLVSVSGELKNLDHLSGSDKANYSRRLKAKLTFAGNMITEIEKDLSGMDVELKQRYAEILLRTKLLRDELSVTNSELLAFQKNMGRPELPGVRSETEESVEDELIRSETGQLTESQEKYNEYQKKYRNYTSAIFHGTGNLEELEKEYRKAFQVYLRSMNPK